MVALALGWIFKIPLKEGVKGMASDGILLMNAFS